jgi:GNAT superfamily N-acetyltransferase
MADSAAAERDELLAFELALDDKVADEVRREDWGRAYLAPSLPLVWDASWVGIERADLPIEAVVEIADEVLGGAGLAHRTACVFDEAAGRRLAETVETEPGRCPGWEVERIRYMAWREAAAAGAEPPLAGEVATGAAPSGFAASDAASGPLPPASAREATFAEIAGLRRALTVELTPNSMDFDATVDQLLELDRRYSERCGDRWFVAPAEGDPASTCRLYRQGGIAQVEDVGTLEAGREKGYAKAIVRAAIAAARSAGDERVFLTADAADWPQLMYAKLGFETVGELTILRRRP